ncbi:phosphopentomutase [Verrucomicrobiales bacterium]|nr:phosphopentomutase [Verrucomicrobiales bacterium]
MRALLIVLDSVGVGYAPDAKVYHDDGANTLEHLYSANPDWSVPCLERLGLTSILNLSTQGSAEASYGWMEEQSDGKDTTTGHWELAGVITEEAFPTYAYFPESLVQELESTTGCHFIGNVNASGTAVIEEFGAEHLETKDLILYTSADSVLQIAAHEDLYPRELLYQICHLARDVADNYRIGRVIARPFTGALGQFERTPGRKDFSIAPPRTILSELSLAAVPTYGVGKISDIFAGEGIDQSFPTASNADGMAEMERLWAKVSHGLVFCNLVDFDMLYGHRRDPKGYAKALTEFDNWLENFRHQIMPEDLVIITADHGNDPTWKGTDHTRERVPLIMLHRNQQHCLGLRRSFTDVAATLAEYFRIPRWDNGHSFLDLLT